MKFFLNNLINADFKNAGTLIGFIILIFTSSYFGFKLWETFETESNLKAVIALQNFLEILKVKGSKNVASDILANKIFYGGLLLSQLLFLLPLLIGAYRHVILKELHRKADHCNPKAQCDLAIRYANGQGVDIDEIQAVNLYRIAAKNKYALAQNNLGFMYQHGNGVTKDEIQAIEWYLKAANQGLTIAQYNLGVIYANGITKNEVQSVEWYRKAAEQGDALAQNNLGVMYLEGRGIDKDEVQAVVWFRKAAKQGQVNAKANLTKLGKIL